LLSQESVYILKTKFLNYSYTKCSTFKLFQLLLFSKAFEFGSRL